MYFIFPASRVVHRAFPRTLVVCGRQTHCVRILCGLARPVFHDQWCAKGAILITMHCLTYVINRLKRFLLWSLFLNSTLTGLLLQLLTEESQLLTD